MRRRAAWQLEFCSNVASEAKVTAVVYRALSLKVCLCVCLKVSRYEDASYFFARVTFVEIG